MCNRVLFLPFVCFVFLCLLLRLEKQILKQISPHCVATARTFLMCAWISHSMLIFTLFSLTSLLCNLGGQGHGHHGHRGIREVQTESTGGSTEEEHEHQRSRRSHEEEDKSELEYHHHHHEPLEHADRRRRDVGSHEEHAHNSDEHDENDPQTTEGTPPGNTSI